MWDLLYLFIISILPLATFSFSEIDNTKRNIAILNFADNLGYNQKIKFTKEEQNWNNVKTTLKASVRRITPNNGGIQTQICVNKWF